MIHAPLLEKICNNRKWVLYFYIPLLSLVMHLHVFNRDIVGFHSWRQTQTQLNIENFAHEDFNILNPRSNNRGNKDGIVRLEFPVMQWLFAIFYKIFGTHIIISRILTFIIGLFSVWGMYYLLYAVFKRIPIALIGAWCFNFSPVFYYYTVNPLPDNLALCLGIWSLAFFFRWVNEQKPGSLIVSAILLGVSALAKLPYVIFSGIAVAYIVRGLVDGNIKRTDVLKLLVIFIAALLPATAWYASVIGSWHVSQTSTGILGVTKKDIPDLLDIMQANLVSALPEMLVNYGALIFFLAGFWFVYKNKIYRNNAFSLFAALGSSVILYFILEMNAIGKVHDYYLFPFLPPIFLVVAYGAERLLEGNNKSLKILSVFALCILPVTAFLRIDHRWNIENPGYNADLYKYKNELRAAVPDNALCVAGNDGSGNIFFYYIHKKGWCFDIDTLSAANLRDYVAKGARYLYSDSRKVEADKGVENYLDKLIVQEGSIKVYSLKPDTLVRVSKL